MVTDENSKYFIEFLDKNFSMYDIEQVDDNSYDIVLDSKWTFPKELFEELTEGLPSKDDVYIRSMSYELGDRYHELQIFEDGSWGEW